MAQLGNYSYDIEAGSHRKKAMRREQWALLVLAQIKARVIIKQLMRAQNVFFSPDYERDPCWNNHHRPF